ncbi:hypothetical protein SOVF_056600 [Spinacia oleracea]|uniref:Protein ELC-like n=1 Tax=Spinacia oleracea TaxID=3562 RepID=A0A9R0I2Y7_SPIOL|nr:protein ELC-like [Spinacia oleracea]KNA19972.1 hypothetical protein SOVF_056600 [Spinacia oleracea]
MKPTSSMEFIDTSLFESGSFELSYKNPTQKWIIRKHFLKLFKDFPCFIPSTNKFDHYDGTTTNLLNISGFLHVSDFSPEVPLIIWLHENYPSAPPMIFIPSNPECPVYENHPYINPSGVVTPPYILHWDQKRSNLCDLIHNLENLFQHDHPSMPMSKSTILYDLVAKISTDLAALEVQTRKDIERESTNQAQLQKRRDVIDDFVTILEVERDNLNKRVVDLREYNDKLLDWLRKNKNGASMACVQVIGDKSKMIDCKASYKALDDVVYGLDEGLEQGVISLDEYMRQVRVLAREQFFHIAMFFKLRPSRS